MKRGRESFPAHHQSFDPDVLAQEVVEDLEAALDFPIFSLPHLSGCNFAELFVTTSSLYSPAAIVRCT